MLQAKNLQLFLDCLLYLCNSSNFIAIHFILEDRVEVQNLQE